MPTNVPLYMDWSFWAVVVAVLALMLSQLPPVLSWFGKAKIEIDAWSRVILAHKLGNPNLALHLILSNTGRKSARIRKVDVVVTRDGQQVFTLPMQTYHQSPDAKGTLLATPFRLGAKEEWSHGANFLNYFNRDEERQYRAMESAIRTNILDKRAERPELTNDQMVEADEEVVAPIMAFFEDRFNWLEGDYEIEVRVTTDEKVVAKKYRFTLFETESEELRKLADHYKHGSGIYWDHPGINTTLGVQLHEVNN